jgi:hypothetical protein
MADRDELMQRFASALDEIPGALDEIPGGVLADAEVDEVELDVRSVRVAAYFRADGKVTNRSSAGKGCPNKTILDVAGWSVTGANGRVDFRLNNFHCVESNFLRYQGPIHLVATPRSGSIPCWVTVETELVAPGGRNDDDIIIRLFSWKPGGNPLGGIRVQWRCMVPFFELMG